MNEKILKFWKNQLNILEWKKKPKIIFKYKKNNFFEWFEDGKINLTYNCIENNLKKGFGNKNAIVFYDKNFVKKIYTYNKLSNLVDSFSKILKKKNK